MFCAHCGQQVQSLAGNCPACGRPAGGAPAPAGSTGASAAVIIVVVVVALLVVVAIVGIIAAIAIPNLLSAINRGRQKRTMADVRTVATAVEAYAVDNGYYPDADSLDDLAGILEREYIAVLPRNDGWMTPMVYACWKDDPTFAGCEQYAVMSAGRDKIFDYDDPEYYGEEENATRDFDCDIVYRNGVFVQFPEGIVR